MFFLFEKEFLIFGDLRILGGPLVFLYMRSPIILGPYQVPLILLAALKANQRHDTRCCHLHAGGPAAVHFPEPASQKKKQCHCRSWLVGTRTAWLFVAPCRVVLKLDLIGKKECRRSCRTNMAVPRTVADAKVALWLKSAQAPRCGMSTVCPVLSTC